MKIQSTAVLAVMVAIAAGCTSEDPSDTNPEPSASPENSESAPVEDRPIYSADVSEEEFCPTGADIQDLDGVPENDAIEVFYNGTRTTEQADQPAAGKLDCDYFYLASDAPVERIADDFATPGAELRILEDAVDPSSHPDVDPSLFPEAPEHFQVTGWAHTATEEESQICLSGTGWLYKDCEDGRSLLMEVFTLTGFDSNLEVEIQVEYRHGGDEAEHAADEIASRSRQIAAGFLLELTERLPTTG